MKVYADNGVYLGEVIWEDNHFWLRITHRTTMSEYMLEQAAQRLREVKTDEH